MKRNILILAVAATCMCGYACDNADIDDNVFSQEYDISVTNTPAGAEDMAKFLEEAHKGVVNAEIYREYDPEMGNLCGGASPEFMIDADGTAIMAHPTSSGPQFWSTQEYTWRIDEKDPTVIIFTDQKGIDHISRLTLYKDDRYYFEGYFPVCNDYYTPSTKKDIIIAFIDTDPSAREKMLDLYYEIKEGRHLGKN